MKIIKRNELTINIIKEYLYYDETIGKFIWIKNTHKFKNRINTIAGSLSKRGHIEIRLLGTLYAAHRLVWFYKTGVMPTLHIDHIDHNESNNLWGNLREVTQRENNMNTSLRSDNTSGVVGVWVKDDKFIAEIRVKNIKISLGSYETIDEASIARKNAEFKYGFHINHGINKPS